MTAGIPPSREAHIVPPIMPRIVEVSARATHDLRRRVLRIDTPSTRVDFDDDTLDDTVHLAVELHGDIIAISTWIVRAHPEHPTTPAVQLRGMATDPAPTIRGAGHGGRLLRAGIDRARAGGAQIVWANARTSVLDFYRAHDFEIEHPEFRDADTGTSHHRIIRFLD